MTLLLLRHGESEGNVQRLIQGWAEYDLTALGRLQAEAAGSHLAGHEVAALYSSPLRRARATAEIVGAQLGLEVLDLPDLREYGFGEAEGLRWQEAQQRFGLAGREWGSGRVPGEEGMPGFRDRVERQIEELAQRHVQDVAVAVIHGGVLGAFAARLMGLEDGAYAQIFAANCGLTTLRPGMDGATSIEVLNEVCHLRDLGAIQKEPWLTP